MKETNTPNNRSPWPACADCQIAEEHGTTSEAVARPAPAEHDLAGEGSFDGLEPSAELGPRRDAIRQAAEEAFARAVARAQESAAAKQHPELETVK